MGHLRQWKSARRVGTTRHASRIQRTVYLHQLLASCALVVLSILVVVDVVARVDAMLGLVL